MILLKAHRGLVGPISVVVLTYNEGRNLGACLESLSALAEDIFVVDSGSSDGTVDVAKLYGAKVVTHPFESHATQWRWALANLPLTTEWVLALDADQRVTSELREDISRTVLAQSAVAETSPVASSDGSRSSEDDGSSMGATTPSTC